MPFIKPRLPVINRSNKLAKRLLYDMCFLEGAGLAPRELITKSLGSLNGTTKPAWIKSLQGYGLDFSTNPSYFQSASLTTTPRTVDRYSVEMIFSRDSGGIGGAYGLLALEGDETKTNSRWDIYNDNGDAGWGLVLEIFFTSLNGCEGWSFPYPGDTNLHHYVFTIDQSSATNDPVMYKDGSPIALTNRYNNGNPTLPATSVVTIGNSPTTVDNNWDGKVLYVRKYNGILTARDVRSLYADPWQVYERPPINYLTNTLATPASTFLSRLALMGAG